MSTASRWTNFALIPVIAVFEGLAWYAMRTVMFVHLLDLGAEDQEIATAMRIMVWVGLFGTLLAGFIALAARPWSLLVTGILLGILGTFRFIFADAESYLAPIVLIAFGHGFVRAAAFGAAARALPDDCEHLRTAVFLLLYGALNFSGLFANVLASLGAGESRVTVVLGTGIGLGSVALLLALALSIVVLVTRKPRAERPEPPPVRVAHLVTVGLLTLIVGATWGTVGTVWELIFDVARPLADTDRTVVTSIINSNAMTVLVLAGVCAALFVVLHFTRVKLPLLLPAGGGFLIFAAGVLMILTANQEEPSLRVLRSAAVVLAFAEVLVMPLVLSRLTGSLPWRLETLVVAVWISMSQLPSGMRFLVEDQQLYTRVLSWAGVGACLLIGLALAAAAFPLRRVFDVPRQIEERAEGNPKEA